IVPAVATTIARADLEITIAHSAPATTIVPHFPAKAAAANAETATIGPSGHTIIVPIEFPITIAGIIGETTTATSSTTTGTITGTTTIGGATTRGTGIGGIAGAGKTRTIPISTTGVGLRGPPSPV